MVSCAHCLLEIPEAAVLKATVDGEEAVFCCRGCLGIYRLLRDEGLSGFYGRREGWTPGPPEASEPFSREAFVDAVRHSGGIAEADLAVSGMRCASCAWLIERYLGKRPGVRSARVSFATGRLRVSWDPAATAIGEVAEAVRALGYIPLPVAAASPERLLRREKSDLLLRFGTAAFLSMQVMLFTAGLYAGYFQGIEEGYRSLFRWLCFVLATPVMFYSGAPFLRGAARGARHGTFGMDALVVVGAFSAYGYSAASLFAGGEIYFDTATMIVTLILLGRFIEAGARIRATETISRLFRLAPSTARKVLAGGGTATVPVASLSPGDIVEIVPGDRVPADGIVTDGRSEADESLLTGESSPVPKAKGDEVVAGSVNGTGRLLVEVARIGAGTALARIAAAVEEAQARKAPVQRMADRAVRIFAPGVLLVAAATVLVRLAWSLSFAGALMAGISVLVVACPCALGLATPLAVLVGSTSAQARGILIRGGDVLERAAAVRCVLMDKTGTLTEGRPRLTDAEGFDGIGRAELLVLAASLEAASEHAIGRAIAATVPPARRLLLEGFHAHPGEGIEGTIGGVRYLLGRPEFLERSGIPFTGIAAESYRRLSSLRGTVVLLAGGSRPLGILATEDALRPGTPEAIRALRKAGMTVAMVTGDDPAVAGRIAAEAGIDEVRARVTPEGKREEIRKARQRYGPVLAVGDGVNDAPALAEADVGVAMGGGAGVALESAGAALLAGDLGLLSTLLSLSASTLRVIRQNLYFAFSYNLVAIPLAVSGKLHPIAAAACMAASSLIVVGNSLRLREAGR